MAVALAHAQEKLAAMRGVTRRKSGEAKRSRPEEEAGFLRERGGFVLGYTAEVAVSDEHFIGGRARDPEPG